MKTLASGLLLRSDKTVLRDFSYQHWTVFLMKNVCSSLNIHILPTELITIISTCYCTLYYSYGFEQDNTQQ